MKKLISSVLVSSLLVTSLSSCGNNDNASSEEDEMYTVSIMMYGDSDSKDTAEVSAAISEITREKIGANVEITRVGFGSYTQQLNLALASNEKIDAFATLGQNITEMADSGQIIPLNPYLDVEGSAIKAGIPVEDFMCAAVGENYYGFPSVKEKATNYGFIMKKSIADVIGVEDETVKTYAELEEVMVKAKEAFPDMYPIGLDFTNIYMPTIADNLDGGIGVLENVFEDNTDVVNWYETNAYSEFVNNMHKWNGMGLIMPDASTNSESRLSLMKSGKVMGGFMGFNPGNVSNCEKELGEELVQFTLTEPYSVTGHVSGVVWCMAGNSENPSKTMEFLNLAYTDPDISNLLINGIEGKHYEIVDADAGIIDYPAGVDASTTGYMRLPWAWPNARISYTWVGEDVNQYEYLDEYNESAHQSIAKGFRFNPENVLNEIAACNNVATKYDLALQTGELNPETTLAIFQKELEDAGVKVIIEEKQKQLDEWLVVNEKK